MEDRIYSGEMSAGRSRIVELLSPARDIAVGMAAVNNGADAVYIGAPAFGARKSAANSLEDIAALVDYAHRFYCRVFVTFNTVLYDHELADAERLIGKLYRIGVDALIIQDPGILRMDIPPICLHASTQMHNYDLERIKFLDRMGFQRIVLARELSLDQIRKIRSEVKAELEVFVHGALCVSLSGQCYLSQYMFGRSANRGECAQPCRMKWSVRDSRNKVLVDNRYILSLKDLNLSASIKDLIDAGVDSFKIEGRLKDEDYVSNVTRYYSSLIDGVPGVERSGSGRIMSSFVPDPERSFNRGCSTYFLNGREKALVNQDTPKSMGKCLGPLVAVKGRRIRINTSEELNNADGLCYLEKGELKGIKVNTVENGWVVCNDVPKVRPGTLIYRNYDHRFVTQLKKAASSRRIAVRMKLGTSAGRLKLEVTDEDGVTAAVSPDTVFEPADNPQQFQRLRQQLMKCGDSDFVCDDVEFIDNEVLFVPVGEANALRRALLAGLAKARADRRTTLKPGQEERGLVYSGPADWHLNVNNRKAAGFYADHGVENVPYGFEKGGATGRVDLMHTRYCILHELGRCRRHSDNGDLAFPLYLYNDKHQFVLDFDCKECFMRILRK